MNVIRGKVALVTGAASGIGKAIAQALAAEGCELMLVDRDETGLKRTESEFAGSGAKLIIHTCDLANPDHIDACIQRAQSEWGGVDILVNNAGMLFFDSFDSMPKEQWDLLMRVNLDAPARLIQGLLPAMQRRQEAHIVNIASILGLTPKRKVVAYSASKFGLVGLSLSLRAELSPKIGVSVICPGLIKSNLYSAAKDEGRSTSTRELPTRLVASPELVARHTINAIRKNKRLVVVTRHAKLARLGHAAIPGVLDALQMKRNRKRQSVASLTSK
jgi:3-oxoacyl-[acyl-carrier protein] reductase